LDLVTIVAAAELSRPTAVASLYVFNPLYNRKLTHQRHYCDVL